MFPLLVLVKSFLSLEAFTADLTEVHVLSIVGSQVVLEMTR